MIGIAIQPTEALVRLQQRIIQVLAPFAVTDRSAAAFAPRSDGRPVSDLTVEYVRHFHALRTAEHFRPHITVGIGRLDFIEALEAEPFEPFPVQAGVTQV